MKQEYSLCYLPQMEVTVTLPPLFKTYYYATLKIHCDSHGSLKNSVYIHIYSVIVIAYVKKITFKCFNIK